MVLAAVVEEVDVVSAYLSCSKSSLLERSTQPNQKENLQPQSQEDRAVQSKYVCDSVKFNSFQTDFRLNLLKESPNTCRQSANIFGKCRLAMLSAMGNKLKHSIKMQQDVPV